MYLAEVEPQFTLAARLEQYRKSRDLDLVLFDLDDTLIKTGKIFRQQIRAYCRYVSRSINKPLEEIEQKLGEIDRGQYQLLKVNPIRWHSVAEELDGFYSTDGQKPFQSAVSILQQTYWVIPEYQEGAKETMELFRQAGFKIGIVTHANKEWTDRKRTWLALDNYVDHVKVVDENIFKDSVHWKEEMDYFGVSPDRVMAVGDNLKGDIISAYNAGARHLVYLPSSWSVYREGEVPPGTIPVEGIGKVPAVLVSS